MTRRRAGIERGGTGEPPSSSSPKQTEVDGNRTHQTSQAGLTDFEDQDGHQYRKHFQRRKKIIRFRSHLRGSPIPATSSRKQDRSLRLIA